MYYLSVASMFKQESHILKEWLDHYILHGVDHFYLINDHSTDNYQLILQPYIDKGLVTLYNYNLETENVGRQSEAYNHYLNRHKNDTKWLAILDLDEFLYSPQEINLKKILEKYENYASIRVHWIHFGSNGYKTQPDNVVQNFVRRAGYDKQFPRYISFKPISQTKMVREFNVHSHNISGEEFMMPKHENADLLINHYCIQSLDFWTKVKHTRGDVNRYYDSMKWERDIELFDKLDSNDVEDLRLAQQNLKKK